MLLRDKEEMKMKIDDGVDNSLASEGTDLFVSGNQNDIVVVGLPCEG